MNYKSLVWIIVFSCMLLIACTEEYDLELSGESKLVIDMTITNEKPPYYVQLIKSKATYAPLNDNERSLIYQNRFEIVSNAY